MTLHLFDTLSRSVRPLRPLDGKSFRFYCCGPTVYGPAHIGNFRTFVIQDVFRRVIEATGLPTRHVRNLTDVDDKTIRGAEAAGQSLSCRLRRPRLPTTPRRTQRRRTPSPANRHDRDAGGQGPCLRRG